MRTTLSLDPDVAHLIQERVAASRLPFKAVVNSLLRQALAAETSTSRGPFVQQSYALGWNESLDPSGFNRLADALATEADVEVLKRHETGR